MMFSPLRKPAQETNGFADEVMGGFSMKSIGENTKDYFKNMGQKFMLKSPGTTETTSGLSGADEVSYFVNPYTQSNQIDLRDLDKISERVAQMSGTEVDPLERNF